MGATDGLGSALAPLLADYHQALRAPLPPAGFSMLLPMLARALREEPPMSEAARETQDAALALLALHCAPALGLAQAERESSSPNPSPNPSPSPSLALTLTSTRTRTRIPTLFLTLTVSLSLSLTPTLAGGARGAGGAAPRRDGARRAAARALRGRPGVSRPGARAEPVPSPSPSPSPSPLTVTLPRALTRRSSRTRTRTLTLTLALNPNPKPSPEQALEPGHLGPLLEAALFADAPTGRAAAMRALALVPALKGLLHPAEGVLAARLWLLRLDADVSHP